MKRVVALTVAAAFALAACGNDSDSSVDDGSGSVDDGGDSMEAFCESVQEVADNDQDPFETDSREDFVAELEKQRDAISAVADSASGEISGDARAVAEAYRENIDSLLALDDPFDRAAVEEAGLSRDDAGPEFEAAVVRLNEYALAECGFDL
jgi:hypothetical protein